jgi:ADP-ribose pyrophosphatase YjhB (NUDIX family)
MPPKWLEWGRALQTTAQNGLAYCKNPFDIQRYEAMRALSAEILATYTGIEPAPLLDLFTNEKGYATPKVDVRGAVILGDSLGDSLGNSRGDTILLVKELLDNGRWTLPGGWADVTDTPGQAVVREIREESGYEARAVKLAMVYDRDSRGHPPMYTSCYKLFFLCEITGGEAAKSIETGGVGFFREDDLPELSISRVTPQEIHALFEHHRRPEMPTEFD